MHRECTATPVNTPLIKVAVWRAPPARPRRFGKSRFLDTLKEFLEGSEERFAGLSIHDRHDWSQRHPVLRLSFGGGTFQEPSALHADAMAQREDLAQATGVPVRHDTAPSGRRFTLLSTLLLACFELLGTYETLQFAIHNPAFGLATQWDPAVPSFIR